MSEPTMLDVLNANCGDVLKAHILNSHFGMSINLIAVRAPVGETERAFAESRARLVEAEPKPATGASALAAFKADAAKPVPFETLPKMLATVRFEDVDPVAAATAAVCSKAEHEEWVSVEEAAALRGSGAPAVSAAAAAQGWQKRRDPDNGKRVQYLKSDVLAGRTRRRAA